jgi:hypothetical protein
MQLQYKEITEKSNTKKIQETIQRSSKLARYSNQRTDKVASIQYAMNGENTKTINNMQKCNRYRLLTMKTTEKKTYTVCNTYHCGNRNCTLCSQIKNSKKVQKMIPLIQKEIDQ